MIKILFAVALIVGGAWLVHSGWTRRDSLVGKADSTLAKLGQKIDGESRVPEHVWYLAGGGALVLVGAGLLFAGKKS